MCGEGKYSLPNRSVKSLLRSLEGAGVSARSGCSRRQTRPQSRTRTESPARIGIIHGPTCPLSMNGGCEPHPHNFDARNPVRRRYWQAKRQERTDLASRRIVKEFCKQNPSPAFAQKKSARSSSSQRRSPPADGRMFFLTSTLHSDAGACSINFTFTCGGRRSQDEVVSHFLAIYKGMPLVRLPPARKEQYEGQCNNATH